MRVIIEGRGEGDIGSVEVRQQPVRIGRDDDCEIVLPSPFVSRVHARIVPQASKVYLETTGLNPTLLNGQDVPPGERREIQLGDTIFIQGYMLGLRSDAGQDPVPRGVSTPGQARFTALVKSVHTSVIGALDPRIVRVDSLNAEEGRVRILRTVGEIVTHLDLQAEADACHYAGREAVRAGVLARVLGTASVKDDAPSFGDAVAYGSHEQARAALTEEVAAELGLCMNAAGRREDIRRIRTGFDSTLDKRPYAFSPGLVDHLTRWLLRKEICDQIYGLGPLTDLINMPDINEIMVVSRDQIYVEKDGVLEETGRSFFSDKIGEHIIERIVAPVGRRIDRSMPMVDARLPDGSRVNAAIPPVALKGPAITIRKFSRDPLTIDDLIAIGALDRRAAGFLRACVKGRKNLVISGGTGSGKTTLLNALSAWIPEKERVVTIEDNAELKLQQRHVVTLEAKPPNVEGRGEITIRDLVRNALRMRPDRIVVGEVRGKEALDMLQAMNTGHEGSMTTAHANSPTDMLLRLEVMALQAEEVPVASIRQQIASAVDIIVQQTRLSDGRRRITHVTEVVDYDPEEGAIVTEDIFARSTTDELAFTGYLPGFTDQLVTAELLRLEEVFG